uniref:Ubiquitin specific peptidase 38 n=1 Tax=Astyanax mexicanus TaxID=7994 RepID=W5KEB2_ASTMX
MDKILEALVSSSHPLPIKRAIVKKVVEAAEKEVTQEQCQALYQLSTRLILQGEDAFQRQVGQQVQEAYARFHRDEFARFLSKEFVLGLLQQGYGTLDRRDPAILDFLHGSLRLLLSCPAVLELAPLLQTEVLRMVCERPEATLCAKLATLLNDFSQCMPRDKTAVLFCQQLVRTFAHFQCPAGQEAELRLYVTQVNSVATLLQGIWKAEPATLLPSLQEVFAIISSTDPSFDPSIALASLVQHIPLQMITVLIKSLTTDQNVKDASMTQALSRMIDWLSWPLANHVDTWVIALLKGLAAVQKFTILIDVTLLKIELVFNRLWYPIVRQGALAVLSHMLLSFQHSPEAFHLVVPHVVSLVQSLQNDGLPTSKAFVLQFTELIHCMMYQYSGFPDLYDSILEAIKVRYPIYSNPSELFIILIVLISLFFHQRAAYAPRNFLEASRPPWFTVGSQQDCSEYLRFLLDRLHEEEKTLRALQTTKPKTDSSDADIIDEGAAHSVPNSLPSSHPEPEDAKGEGQTLVERMFGGRLSTGIRCLQCHSLSEKEEPFTDLSLAFCPPALQSTVGPCQGSVNGGSENSEGPVKEPQSVGRPTSEPALSLTDLVEYFLAPEILEEENCYFCERCGSLQRAERAMRVVAAPEYLILTLLRFSYDATCHVRRKILDNVRIPRRMCLPVHQHHASASNTGAATVALSSSSSSSSPLAPMDSPESGENLAKKLKPSRREEEEEEEQEKGLTDSGREGGLRGERSDMHSVPYVLSSVVMHSGMSSESGHYYSYGRNVSGTDRCAVASTLANPCCRTSETDAGLSNSSQSESCAAPREVLESAGQNSRDWFLFNDSRVTFTNFQSVQNITSRFPKDTAYVLIYRKQDVIGQSGGAQGSMNGSRLNAEPPLHKDLMDAITKDNKLFLQEQELNARTRALQAASASCSFRPNGSDDNEPPGSCGPSGGGGGGGFNTVSRLVF